MPPRVCQIEQTQPDTLTVDVDTGVAGGTSTADVEDQLRRRLRAARLVFELGVSASEKKTLGIHVGGLVRSGKTPRDLSETYPALYATYLAFTGALEYDGGDFWSHVVPGLSDANKKPGPAFLSALERLNLETFDTIFEHDQSAQTWLSRILAQGGIPKSCLPQFAELLVKERERGLSGSDELVSAWSQDPERLRYLHKPTQRFIQHGDATARDLLDRCMEALNHKVRTGSVPDEHEVGLPQYFLDALTGASVRRRSSRVQAFDSGVPKPWIEVDPYGGLGPVVVLPPVDSRHGDGTWQIISEGQGINSARASLLETSRIKVEPGRFYNISFSDGAGTMRRWEITGLGSKGFMAFDPESGALARGQQALPMSDVWLMVTAGSTVRRDGDGAGEEPRRIEQMPTMAGDWSGYELLHLDLEGLSGLKIETDGEVEWIPVIKPKEKPGLIGSTLGGVLDDRGNEVFSSPPRVHLPYAGRGDAKWSVALGDGSGHRLETIEPGTREVDLGSLFPDLEAGTFSLKVRGPLGSDFVTAFSLVPSLVVDRPSELILPGATAPTVTVQTSRGSIDGAEVGRAVTRTLDESDTGALFEVNVDGSTVGLRVTVPRLLWTVVHDTKPRVAPDAVVDRVGKEEFDDALADLLHVQAGKPGIRVWLELHRDDEILGVSPEGTTQGKDGRWSFDLVVFADTIRQSQAGYLAIKLVVGPNTITVASILAKVSPTAAEVIAEVDGKTVVRFEKNREVTGLTARLWSVVRPWTPAVEAPVGLDDNSAEFAAEQLAPGPYRLELDVVGDFEVFAPERPRAFEERTCEVFVGDRDEYQAALGALDEGDPVTSLIRVLAGWPYEVEMVRDLKPVAGEIAAAALDWTSGSKPAGRRSVGTRGLLRANDLVLSAGLNEVAEEGENERNERILMTRLALRVVGDYDPTSDEISNEQMEKLWSSCPPVACLLDLPWASYEGAEEATKRCDDALMWLPKDGEFKPEGGQITPVFLENSSEWLADIRGIFLMERTREETGILMPNELQLATVDWLLAEKGVKSPFPDAIRPSEWYPRASTFPGWKFLVPLGKQGELIRPHLESRQGKGPDSWASFPERVLAACAHVAWRTDWKDEAAEQLHTVIPYAHRLVEHDLIVAMALRELAEQSTGDEV